MTIREIRAALEKYGDLADLRDAIEGRHIEALVADHLRMKYAIEEAIERLGPRSQSALILRNALADLKIKEENYCVTKRKPED